MKQQNNKSLIVPLTKKDMRDTNHYREFVRGYRVSLDDEEFRLFVINETTRTCRGYILKLMLRNGRIAEIDFDKKIYQNIYKQACSVFDIFQRKQWKNKGTIYHCYKYIVFGKNDRGAFELMRQIIDHIETL